ncbi:hypothetical protein D3C81_1767210 [compost metagenome]
MPICLFSGGRITFREATTEPFIRISPEVGCSKPASILSKVVFPQPDGPRIATNSPFAILRFIDFNA